MHALLTTIRDGDTQVLYHDREGKNWEAGGAAPFRRRSTISHLPKHCDAAALGTARLLGPKTVRLMTSDHLVPDVNNRIADTMDPAAEGYGFGLGFAVRRGNGVAALAGTAGDYYWSGVYGTYFWVDPVEEISCVLMAAAPGPIRLRFRQLSRALVYQAMRSIARWGRQRAERPERNTKGSSRRAVALPTKSVECDAFLALPNFLETLFVYLDGAGLVHAPSPSAAVCVFKRVADA